MNLISQELTSKEKNDVLELIKIHLNQLELFIKEPEFKKIGFGVGGAYVSWLRTVEKYILKYDAKIAEYTIANLPNDYVLPTFNNLCDLALCFILYPNNKKYKAAYKNYKKALQAFKK